MIEIRNWIWQRLSNDTLDKTTIIDEEEEVNEEDSCSKNDEDEAKAGDETGVSKLKVSQYF